MAYLVVAKLEVSNNTLDYPINATQVGPLYATSGSTEMFAERKVFLA